MHFPAGSPACMPRHAGPAARFRGRDQLLQVDTVPARLRRTLTVGSHLPRVHAHVHVRGASRPTSSAPTHVSLAPHRGPLGRPRHIRSPARRREASHSRSTFVGARTKPATPSRRIRASNCTPRSSSVGQQAHAAERARASRRCAADVVVVFGVGPAAHRRSARSRRQMDHIDARGLAAAQLRPSPRYTAIPPPAARETAGVRPTTRASSTGRCRRPGGFRARPS